MGACATSIMAMRLRKWFRECSQALHWTGLLIRRAGGTRGLPSDLLSLTFTVILEVDLFRGTRFCRCMDVRSRKTHLQHAVLLARGCDNVQVEWCLLLAIIGDKPVARQCSIGAQAVGMHCLWHDGAFIELCRPAS